ncbi:phospholipase [soil metagenome]
MSDDRRNSHPFALPIGAVAPPVEATFIPHRYEPNYAYPLLVLLHGRGGDEQQLVRSMPTMSWRNYIGLGLRGPELIHRQGQSAGFGWGPAFQRPRCRVGRILEPPRPEVILDRVFQHGVADEIDLLEDHVVAAVRQTRRALHVHSERIFLVGTGEGAAVAYRLGMTYPERFAGVVALNGWIPGAFRPLARWRACRSLRVLVAHGQWNGRAPIDDARRDVALLRAAGVHVSFQTYPTAHRLTSRMLSDVDTWLINQCTADRE